MEDQERQRFLDEITSLKQENELLRQKLDLVLRKLFGSSSEKLDSAQLELLLTDAPSKKAPAAGASSDVPAAEIPTSIRPAKRKSRRPRLPEDLPVEEIILDPEPVKACPDAWKCIGSETSEQLDYQPGRFLRRRLVRRKYVRLADRQAPPVIAPLPTGLREACLATPALITEIIVNKYAWHQPLYRQESLFTQRHGVIIPRQTMMNWEELAAGWLRPLHQHLRRSLLTAGYLQVDETPVRYLAPGNGKTLTGYFWVYRSATGTLLYDWRPSRAHHCLDEVLSLHEHGRDTVRYQGILQTDGYAAYGTYQRLATHRHQPVILAACWAHTRRKFHEAREQSPRLVGWILRQIGHLYTVEKNLRDQRAGPTLRQALRASQSTPIYQRLGKVFENLSSRRIILPKSNLGMALRYAIELLPRLGVFLQDGRVELDTNLVENAIRPTAVGKKNWLFIGHEESGWKAAIFYTLIGNCRHLGIDPHVYLKDVLEKLPTTTNHTLADLLPANWAKQSRA